jgi:hypothetical protein
MIRTIFAAAAIAAAAVGAANDTDTVPVWANRHM